MKSRKDLPQFLNSLALTGAGAEIGVYRGDFSAHILSEWKGEILYSIDSWTHQGNMFDASDASHAEHMKNMRACKEKLRPFKKRSVIIREYSHHAAHAFAKYDNAELDFVYIDAAHDYRSVWSDLETWFPRIKSGGLFSGHDYKNSFVRKNLVEVKRAVDDFFRMYELTVNSTVDDNLPSWYIIKP